MSGILVPKPMLGRQLRKGHRSARGLAGYWLFNEGSGNIVSDLSGNGETGTFGAGAASPSWTAGKFGSALSFDGGDYVATTLTPFKIHNATTGDITFNIWVNFASTLEANSPIGADDGGVDRFYLNTVAGGHLRVGIGSWFIGYNDVVVAGKWTLYSVVISGTTGYFYVDGVLRGTEAGITLDYPDKPIHFGRIETVHNLTGLIDVPSFYNRALSASEIAELYLRPFIDFEREPLPLWTAATQGVIVTGQPTMRRWANIPHMSYLGRRSA